MTGSEPRHVQVSTSFNGVGREDRSSVSRAPLLMPTTPVVELLNAQAMCGGLKPVLCGADGVWTADYTRLRFQAFKHAERPRRESVPPAYNVPYG